MVPGWYPEIAGNYIYTYIYIYIYIYTYTHIYIHIYIYIRILMPQNVIIIDFDPRPILFKKRLAFDR